MLGHIVARKPAPVLAWRPIGVRLRLGPTALGNALGGSIVNAMSADSDLSNENYRNEMDRDSDAATARASALSQAVSKSVAGFSSDQLAYWNDALQTKGGIENFNPAQLDDVLSGVAASYVPTTLQIQQADSHLDFVNALGLSPLAAQSDPHTYYVPIVFDGTDNNKDTMAFPTNPGIFANSLFGTENGNVLPTIYETGLGTGPEGALMGGAFGAGGQDREGAAMQALSSNMASIYASDPDAQIVIVGVGFSRGAAELRDFANQVNQGVPIPGTTDDATGQPQTYSGAQAPRFGAMVIYDTVGSFGLPGTDLNPGYDLSIAPNVEHVLSISSENEQRAFFPFSSATSSTDLTGASDDGRIVQVGLPGAHSNIGGGYAGAYQYYALDMAHSFLSQLGVPVNPLVTQQYDYDVHDYDASSLRLQNSNWGIDNIFQSIGVESHNRVVYPANNPSFSGAH